MSSNNSTTNPPTIKSRTESSSKQTLKYFYRKHFDLKMCALYDIGILHSRKILLFHFLRN
jgi:hypothetical protein